MALVAPRRLAGTRPPDREALGSRCAGGAREGVRQKARTGWERHRADPSRAERHQEQGCER